MTEKSDLQYCEQIEAHMDDGGKVHAHNVRDLAGMVRQAYSSRYPLASALKTCLEAINPPDRSGISMHEWSGRLRVATAQGEAALKTCQIAEESETC